ncbi:hypothetical protein C8R44DRAFT_882024 [Mycena epipterygia]|nr:hypothetical protein C8R44DRAFT_882024 [Mycena epipterygia]
MSTSSASSSVASFGESHSSTSSQPKDYAVAFATLQSAYGLVGQAPSIRSKKHRSTTSKKSIVRTDSPRSNAAAEDYESAFGALSSQFGLGGAAPSKAHV